MSNVATIEATPKNSVLIAMAQRFGMMPSAFEATLRATVVPNNCSKEQFAAFLMVAKEYNLNPVTKEIYAFPAKGGGIQPIVGIDGWMSIINDHPYFDGMEFEDIMDGDNITAITCRIFRKDRKHPTAVTEYMSECKRDTEPWKKWPARMLRHKAAIQCSRYAFGFSGIIEPDEYERGELRDITPPSPPPAPPSPPKAEQEIIPPKAKKPGRKPGEPRTNKTPYTERAAQATDHDPETGKVVDDGEPFDPDHFLDDIEAQMAACSDQATLEEVWNTQVEPFVEDGTLFPPDRQKADDIYQRNMDRLEKDQKGEQD